MSQRGSVLSRATSAFGRRGGIIRVGENAWRSVKAERLAFLIDAARYYQVLDESLRRAEREILIVGWDFDPDICLRPDLPDSPTLGTILESLVDANPLLQVRILVWAMGPIYSGKSLKLFRRSGWPQHPRIELRFDGRHPIRGSHHQKMVSIDDRIAFLGGIDLTARRWDDDRHLPDNPLRVTPKGEAYEPVHDMQAMLSGPAAIGVGDLIRLRWRGAVGPIEAPGLAAPDAVEAADIWPDSIKPDLTDCRVAIARTEPDGPDHDGHQESISLLKDALKAARKHVYIEAQYLASFGIADIIARHLENPEGPEILIVVSRISHGFIEKIMMGNNRDRLIRQLKRRDPYDRFRVMYSVVPKAGGGEQEVLVHSKLVVVDDVFLRIGSSNLNNRSEGLDTEADIAVEAVSETHRQAITALRDRLLAEHLDVTPEAVSRSIAETGSLLDGVEAVNHNLRGLRHFDVDVAKGAVDPIPGTAIVDPHRPFRPVKAVLTGMSQLARKLRTAVF
ncbi:phospholipase D-like domain-containing protein [Rhizobium rhizosphaerae]|uniref:phospholipase D-like domain-containing protein n=1 Tax=Xaviernesmea rhizosphaerae TaxID=1672749 RepID=UPI000B13D0AF|nr:phospholipase D-like domain-containing protein [Xaviernesmea rhizosphaerae]